MKAEEPGITYRRHPMQNRFTNPVRSALLATILTFAAAGRRVAARRQLNGIYPGLQPRGYHTQPEE